MRPQSPGPRPYSGESRNRVGLPAVGCPWTGMTQGHVSHGITATRRELECQASCTGSYIRASPCIARARGLQCVPRLSLPVALAITIAVGALYLAVRAIEVGLKAPSANHLTNIDRCPYYPPPVVCRNDSRAHTTIESLTSRDSNEPPASTYQLFRTSRRSESALRICGKTIGDGRSLPSFGFG
jgi:hypothetical protein